MKNRTDRVPHFERKYVRMATVKKTTAVKEEVKKVVSEEVKPTVKAETVKAEVKADAKAEAKPVAKKETVKKEAAKKETVKKAPTKKADTKSAAKAPAKKAAVKENISVQFAGKSYTTEDLVKIAKDVWKYDLKQKATDFKSVELYVKPEESMVYYVINGDVTGNFAI